MLQEILLHLQGIEMREPVAILLKIIIPVVDVGKSARSGLPYSKEFHYVRAKKKHYDSDFFGW